MIFQRLFASGAARIAGRRLIKSATGQSRAAFLYADLGAPDTVEGRFEMLTLHVILLMARLGEGDTRQALFDAYLADLDGALREMGVGDLVVGKRMRKLGEAFYGRARSWSGALTDEDAAGLLCRTVYAGGQEAQAAGLAAYVRRCREGLAVQADLAIRDGEVTWPAR